jgi:predicted PurR-regulated permease PerM
MPSPANRARTAPSFGRFTGYCAVALGLAALFFLGWRMRDVLVLAFGALVVAVIIRATARPLLRRFPRREKVSVLSAVLALLLGLGGVGWLLGHQVSEQMRELQQRLPEAIQSGRQWLEARPFGSLVLSQFSAGGTKSPSANSNPDTAEKTTDSAGSGATEKESAAKSAPADGGGAGGWKRALGTLFDAVGHGLLMLVAGIYFAVTPRLYLDGTVRLFPPAQREKVRNALLAAGESLRLWLVGQLVSMATIGTLTTLGLWAVGCPLPLALGVLAGLLVFVPVVGFLVAFIPTILIALSEGTQVAMAAIIVFLIVQQIEEQVVQPLAQRWATSLPPALGLLALAGAGVLFGVPGLIFGCPLTVVVLCLVKKLYLEHGIERA